VEAATTPSRLPVVRKPGESAVDTDGERLTIRHISTVLVEFATKKHSEQKGGADSLSKNG